MATNIDRILKKAQYTVGMVTCFSGALWILFV